MTKDGKENRFGRFVFTDEQAERAEAGDHSVIWEFIEDNRGYLTGWAKKFIRRKLDFLPRGYIEADEMLNQIYVDFPFYNLESGNSLRISIHRSYIGITCGGILRSGTNHGRRIETSIDAPQSVSVRSGDVSDGSTLKDLLPSGEPTPLQVLENKEHMQELMPHYFREIGRIFKQDGGATVGELLEFAEKGEAKNGFQDVIEEVFFGYTFDEVKEYAKRTA